jgi:DinB superfamily/Pentapeptide repeats (9 copies)
MIEFRDRDLNGAHFEHVTLCNSTFDDAQLNGTVLHDVDLTGTQIRQALLNGSRWRGVELVDVEISGELQNVLVNGVDIAPLVNAELDRRMPERAMMRPDDSDGFREAWAILERLWGGTEARARVFPESELHHSVDEEWSFIQTLRHLNFATAAWVGRMILGNPFPWHGLDLHWDVSSRFKASRPAGWDRIPWDREARPSLEAVLEVRRERQAMVRSVMASLTDDELASRVTCTQPGWPQLENFPFKECLRIVLYEEWEHRLYAERDLTALEQHSDQTTHLADE